MFKWFKRLLHLHEEVNESEYLNKEARDKLHELIIFCKENYVPRDREFSISAMSRRFGVNRATLGSAIRGDTWNHLP